VSTLRTSDAPARRERSPTNGDAPPWRGAGPPEPIGPVPAILRHPLLALLIVVACTAAGVAAGLERTPQYTAEARLSVGNIDVQSQALPGYVSAVQSLAGSYSRAIDSPEVVDPVAEELGLGRAEVARHISASPVPESSVIRVTAIGTDEQDTTELANAAAASLREYVRDLDSGPDSSEGLLREYRRAKLEAERTGRIRDNREEEAGLGGSSEALREAQADFSAADLRARSLAAQYQQSLEQSPPANFIKSLTDASSAADDRISALQLRALTGFVAGLVLAAAIVTALANRRRRRGSW
jgi:capsular polysaccharide biosynthesis protein